MICGHLEHQDKGAISCLHTRRGSKWKAPDQPYRFRAERCGDVIKIKLSNYYIIWPVSRPQYSELISIV